MKSTLRDMVLKDPALLVVSSLLLAAYLFPIFQYGIDVYVAPFDFLDIALPSAKILAQSGMLFADNNAPIPNMMGGLPRYVYGSEFNYFVWLFKFVSPFNAYRVQEVLMHVSAFFGMLLLLRRLLPFRRGDNRNDTVPILVYGVSLLYAFLPFFPGMGLSIPLLPLGFYLMLRIRDRDVNAWVWAALFLLPFFTSFVLVYSFFLLSVLLWWLVDAIRNRHFNLPWLLVIVLLLSLYLFVNYRLVEVMFFSDVFVSHRTEFVRRFIGFFDAYRGAHNAFLLGQSHSRSWQNPYIVPTVLFGLLVGYTRRPKTEKFYLMAGMIFLVGLGLGIWSELIRQKYFLPLLVLTLLWIAKRKRGAPRTVALGVLLIALGAYWYGFWYFERWRSIVDTISIVREFDFSRFVLLLPPLWYVILAFTLWIIVCRMKTIGAMLAVVILAMQAFLLFEHRSFYYNKKGLTFKSYYDTALFAKAEALIGAPKETYRVGSIGIPPAVALYNGFYTLDGYSPNYPLAYKHRFEKIIEPNFKRNKNAERFFKQWGSKCYLVAGNKGYDQYEKGAKMRFFAMDTAVFSRMQGRYLFSGYEIDIQKTDGLQLMRHFPNPGGFWALWVYKVVEVQK